jgi:altronate hydrolase
MMNPSRKVLILDERDNIAVSLVDLTIGEIIEQDGRKIAALNDIPRGHKIAIEPIAKDEGIIKYGERMGHAIAPIAIGEHVHVHNILGDRLSAEQV